MTRDLQTPPRVLAIIALMISALGLTYAGTVNTAGIEIVEVKNVGVSASDESKSVIQVKWKADAQSGTELKTFDVAIEVGYADGAVQKARNSVGGSARSARFELPTLHFTPGRPSAELKSFKASVTASITETATRQGSL